MILKMILKFFLKLLFFGRTAYELSSTEFKSKAGLIKDKMSQAERDGEEAYTTVYKKFSRMEEDLNGKMENIQKKILGNGSFENTSEVNDLRADLAELRAEMREMKRRLSVRSENGD